MRGTVVKMKKKNHWKNICALFFSFCMVFSTVAGDASFVTASAAEVQTAAGERSRQHGRCTEHNKSRKCGADRERRSDGRSADRGCSADGCSADRWCSAGGCGTGYRVWGRLEYGAHPDGGGRKPCGLQLYGGTGSGTSGSSDSGQRNA